MSKGGIALVALLVGCAAGLAVRGIEFPARAAAGPTYSYRVVSTRDLIANVRTKNAQFKDADAREVLEEGMKGFGAAGWRYAGCLQSSTMGWGWNVCDHLIFESATGADASPPPARTTTPAPPEESTGATHR
jgi:hypothetical protein